MALILETGVGLADADSYVSLAEVRAFATSRGRTVPAVDAGLEALIRRANDYLASVEDRFQGYRRTASQALPFPRDRIHIHGRYRADGVIPLTLKLAVFHLVVEMQTVDILPTSDGRVVISETVGPISTTYANPGTAASSPIFQRVDVYLCPLFRSAFNLSSVRV